MQCLICSFPCESDILETRHTLAFWWTVHCIMQLSKQLPGLISCLFLSLRVPATSCLSFIHDGLKLVWFLILGLFLWQQQLKLCDTLLPGFLPLCARASGGHPYTDCTYWHVGLPRFAPYTDCTSYVGQLRLAPYTDYTSWYVGQHRLAPYTDCPSYVGQLRLALHRDCTSYVGQLRLAIYTDCMSWYE